MAAFKMSGIDRAGGHGFPAFSDRPVLRFSVFAALYAAQGFPYGLLAVAVPAYMAEQGISPAAIGSFIGIGLLPWSLKLINGPIMDRWSFLPMGRRRPWVLAAQAGMVVSSIGMAFVADPFNHLAWLTAFSFTVNFFTAFQDVAVDGMAIEIIPVSQQARANGFMWGGKTVGIAIATFGGAWILNAYGLAYAMLAHAILIGLVMLLPLFIRERPGERILPWTTGEASQASRQSQLEGWSDIGRSLFRVFILPVSLLGALAVFAHTMLRGLLNAMLPVLTVQQLGWSDSAYSEVAAMAGSAAGLIGMALGGLFVERLGQRRSITAGSIVLVIISIAMGLFPAVWTTPGSVKAYVWMYMTFDTLITIAFFAILMSACWKRVAASQFSLYMAIANIGLSTGSTLLGPLHAWFDYNELFFLAAAMSITVVAVIPFVNLQRHLDRVNAIDAAESSSVAAVYQGVSPKSSSKQTPLLG
jgi:PAT family beta-lactamase induction signal transducer AmpG